MTVMGEVTVRAGLANLDGGIAVNTQVHRQSVRRQCAIAGRLELGDTQIVDREGNCIAGNCGRRLAEEMDELAGEKAALKAELAEAKAAIKALEAERDADKNEIWTALRALRRGGGGVSGAPCVGGRRRGEGAGEDALR